MQTRKKTILEPHQADQQVLVGNAGVAILFLTEKEGGGGKGKRRSSDVSAAKTKVGGAQSGLVVLSTKLYLGTGEAQFYIRGTTRKDTELHQGSGTQNAVCSKNGNNAKGTGEKKIRKKRRASRKGRFNAGAAWWIHGSGPLVSNEHAEGTRVRKERNSTIDRRINLRGTLKG